MKLLFYCDTVFSFGGVQRVLAEITKALSKEHEVTILTTDEFEDLTMYDYGKSNVHFEYIQYLDVSCWEFLLCKCYSFLFKNILPHNRITSDYYAKTSFMPTYRKALANKINKGRYDIVIGVHAYFSFHLASICDKISAHTIGWMHNSYQAFFEKKSPYLPKLEKHFLWQMPKLDKIVVLSHADEALFIQRMKIHPVVIYNPLTVSVQEKSTLTNKRILSVGRFDFRHKGFDILIKAFALFVKTHSDWTLEIVGEGQEETLYRSLIAEKKLEGKVLLSPFTKHIQKHYMDASIYVLSSRWEGFGLVLIEAMAHGLPIISSDVPVALELMKDKNVALFFKNEDVEGLAKCLEDMIDGDKIRKMGDKACKYSKNFGIEMVVEKWNLIFKN